MGTCKTMARVHSIPQVYKLGYHTRTRKTRDLKPAGFLVPVTYPMTTCILDIEYEVQQKKFHFCHSLVLMDLHLDAHNTAHIMFCL